MGCTCRQFDVHVSLGVRIEVRVEVNCIFGDCVKSLLIKRRCMCRCSAITVVGTVTVKRY